MKTKSLFLALAIIFTSYISNAQQKYEVAMNTSPEPPAATYTGSHGPFYNGTINDPTIPSRSAVPVGSLKGIKRNFTDKVIEGDTSMSNEKMMIGDDMNPVQKKKPAGTKAKKESKWHVW